ncbi:MAG: hypothetical protein AB1797_13190 [bacterium]
MVIPCPACRLNLLKVGDKVEHNPELKPKLEKIIGEELPADKLNIKHPLDIIINAHALSCKKRKK